MLPWQPYCHWANRSVEESCAFRLSPRQDFQVGTGHLPRPTDR